MRINERVDQLISTGVTTRRGAIATALSEKSMLEPGGTPITPMAATSLLDEPIRCRDFAQLRSRLR